MKWLTNYYLAEGPGIPKNEPRKTGLALVAATVWREGIDLMKLNMLFVLFALPIITLPAAMAALLRVTLVMAEDRNVYLVRDFTTAFRRHFVQASLAGLLVALLTIIPTVAAIAYGRLATADILYAPVFVLAMCVAALMMIAGAYLFALLVSFEAPVAKLVLPALRAAVMWPLPVLAALGFNLLLWLAHIVFYPVSVFMPAVINFSFGALAIAFGVLETVKRSGGSREDQTGGAQEAMPVV